MQSIASSRSQRSQQPTAGRRSRVRRGLLTLLLLPALLVALPALAASDPDEYDSKESGHPLRIAAYVLHPVGVILDALIFRPAHWIGSKEPIKTLVGNTD